MDELLQAAFRAARYRIRAPGGDLVLGVDQPSVPLARLLTGMNAGDAALLTACNPGGRPQAEALNRAARAELLRDAEHAGHGTLPACNEDPRGLWPDEPSLLVPGLGFGAAHALAARYGQAAFLWIDAASGTPRLIETAAPLMPD